jgi:hypothetical protein
MKSGQWATFEGSTRSKTAYQLYRTLLSKLSSELRPEYIDQWPVMFRGEQGSLTANESKMRYQEFLKNLKQVCRLLGYDEDMLGTHSLLRGSVTDQFQCGIPGQVIKTSGRWKSADFQHYIDQETILPCRVLKLDSLAPIYLSYSHNVFYDRVGKLFFGRNLLELLLRVTQVNWSPRIKFYYPVVKGI